VLTQHPCDVAQDVPQFPDLRPHIVQMRLQRQFLLLHRQLDLLEGPIKEGTIRPDGTAMLVRYKPIQHTTLSTRSEKPYSAEEIEPVKAFLRSKGIRLAHLERQVGRTPQSAHR